MAAADEISDANLLAKTEDTDECPSAQSPSALKTCSIPSHRNHGADAEFLNASLEGASAANAGTTPDGWKRFVRPLANCIACGDVETQVGGLRKKLLSTSTSLEKCGRKLREREDHAKLVETQLERSTQELSSLKMELETERRRTTSLSSMLLSDSVSQKKLQDEVTLADERLRAAQEQIWNLSSSLEGERSECQKLAEALQAKASEAELRSSELQHCSVELEDLRSNLENSKERSQRLQGALQENSQENATLKERLQQRQSELEKSESQVQLVSSELSQTTRKLTETETEREAVERRLAATKVQLDQYEERLSSLSASLEAAQRETASRSKKMEVTSMEAEDFLGHLNLSKARVRYLEEQACKSAALLETKHQEQQQLLQQAEAQADSYQSKLTSLSSFLDQEQSQSAALREELRHRDQQIDDLTASASASRAQVESLTEEKGSLAKTLKAKEQENEELKSQISSMNQQVSDYEHQVKELYATLSQTQLENSRLAEGLERRAMEAEEFMGRIKEERTQLAEFECTIRSSQASLQTSLADKDDLTQELERTCLEREDLTQQLLRAQEKLVQLEVEVGNSFLKAAEESKQVRDSSAKEVCQWQITAEMAYQQTTEIARQLDNWRSQYGSLLKALQDKQAVIEKLNDELDHAKKRLTEVAQVDDAELATLKEQLAQANARLCALSAAIDLKDTEMQLVARELMRKGMQAEDYLGQVRSMKDQLVQSEIDLSRFSSELTVSQLEKDALAQKLEHSGKHAEELSGEMQSMRTQLQRCRQETSILDRCLEDRQLQNDLLSREISTKDAEIQDLRCELTSFRWERQDSERQSTASLEVMRSTLQEQLQQNELLSAELTKKRLECQAQSAESQSLREELSRALEAKSEARCQVEGLRELAKQLKEELLTSQRKQATMAEDLDSLAEAKGRFEAKASRLTQICKQQAEEKEALTDELRSSVGSVQHLQSQLAKYRQQIKENQAKIDSLTRSLKREVQKKDEAATRCAELLCSHPSMCIEAWIGRVRTFRDTDGWQLVAGSGFDERIILNGGDTSGQLQTTAGETPCIIINAAKHRKERKEEDRVPVRVYNAKKPGAVAVRKATPETDMLLNQITVFDKMRRLFQKNRLIYDQNFGIVRPYPDGASTRSSSEASFH